LKVGKFDPNFQRSEDWDLWQRIARTGALFGSVPDVLAFYRMRPNADSLDAELLFRDGLRVLRTGHSSDSRVESPHPSHALGLPPEAIVTQEFYLLCWCAGLMLGSGKEARSLFKYVQNDHFPELYPEAVAKCIFDSVPLPTCQPPEKWEELATDILKQVDQFLFLLEDQSRATGLAGQAGFHLRKMILKHSPEWKSVIEMYEEKISAYNDSESAYEARISAYEERISAYEERIAAYNKAAEERESTIRNKESQLEELRQETNRRISELEIERDTWQNRASRLKTRLSELRKTLWVRTGFKLHFLKGRSQETDHTQNDLKE
jgi:chaperonin cofactor prefoldin